MENLEDEIKLPTPVFRECNVGWVVVDAYLEGLAQSANQLLNDPEFKKRFDELRRYTNQMLCGTDDYDLSDILVTVVREIEP